MRARTVQTARVMATPSLATAREVVISARVLTKSYRAVTAPIRGRVLRDSAGPVQVGGGSSSSVT